MQTMISRFAAPALAAAAALILITACKPKKETIVPPVTAPITNAVPAPPVVEAVVTNAAPVTNALMVISPADARKYIGSTVTVRGVVADVKVTQKGDVFLNFGGKYPNVLFTAACFQGAIPTAELTVLKGRTISVSGKIKDYNGQVEIVLESADQIKK